ncbi:MAG: AAA family ATPase [Alistipes sp.]|nr:AAA family ATPase [Alistipes sp.]
MIKLAIADNNVDYVQRMLNVLEKYDDVNISVYTDKNAFEVALMKKKFDVILFSPEVYDAHSKLQKNTLAVLLYDENAFIAEEYKNSKKIRKYQRISKIYQQVLELYSEVSGEVEGILGAGQNKTIAFFSPVGGVGKTTIALAVATRLSMMGKKVFYMSLEDIASEEFYLTQGTNHGLSEIVANLGTDINFSMKIQALVQNKNDNFFYLNHFDSPNDIYEMKPEEVTELIESIKHSNLFDVIIIDTGVSVDEKMVNVFEAVEKIVLIERTDVVSVIKLNKFLELNHIINEYVHKMVRVLNFDNGRGSGLETPIPLIGRINVTQNPDAGQLVTVLSNSAGMDFVTQLYA